MNLLSAANRLYTPISQAQSQIAKVEERAPLIGRTAGRTNCVADATITLGDSIRLTTAKQTDLERGMLYPSAIVSNSAQRTGSSRMNSILAASATGLSLTAIGISGCSISARLISLDHPNASVIALMLGVSALLAAPVTAAVVAVDVDRRNR